VDEKIEQRLEELFQHITDEVLVQGAITYWAVKNLVLEKEATGAFVDPRSPATRERLRQQIEDDMNEYLQISGILRSVVEDRVEQLRDDQSASASD